MVYKGGAAEGGAIVKETKAAEQYMVKIVGNGSGGIGKYLPAKPMATSAMGSNCNKVAIKVQKILAGEFLQITPKFSQFRFIEAVKHLGESEFGWYFYVTYIKDGIVCDKMTETAGMVYSEYIKKFVDAPYLNFNIEKTCTLK